MAVLLGLLVAVSYGAADFFGGMASRRTATTSVVVIAQLLGLALLGVVMVAAPSGTLMVRDIRFGAAAGACGGVGVFLLFRGLAAGRMSVVAPITAVGAAVLPVVWGLATGEHLHVVVAAGVVLALAAVVLVSRNDGDSEPMPASSIAWAVGAGIAFGTLFILYAQTGDHAGWWPLVSARVAAVAVVGVGALATGSALVPQRAAWRVVAVCGVLDVTANALYLLAVRRGLLSLVAVLSSLYPAATVVLARLVLKERLGRVQIAGLAMALGGVALIAVG